MRVARDLFPATHVSSVTNHREVLSMSKKNRLKSACAGISGVAALSLCLSGCNAATNGTGATASPPSGGSDPAAPISSTTQTPAPARSYTTAVLLYEGSGVSTSDAQSLEAILASAKISYTAVTSAQLNTMTAAQFASYGMFLVPGGTANTMSNSLTSSTIQLIQNAVSQDGMGYLGICAGAFLAGNYGSWGLALTSNGFNYYVAESQGITEEAVQVSFPDGSQKGLIWYGGPKLDGFGSVVGKYPDGTIAIAQETSGKGFVLLSGVHPEAPASWRVGMTGADGTAEDFAYVVTLVQATLAHSPLPSF
jgi:glutamine amidotransferase-like uncharacterized protein